jgi:hypothetical protein
MDKLKIFTLENNEDVLEIIKTVCRNHHLHIEISSHLAMKVIAKESEIYLSGLEYHQGEEITVPPVSMMILVTEY